MVLYDDRKRSEEFLGVGEGLKHFQKPKLTPQKVLLLVSGQHWVLSITSSILLVKQLPLSRTVHQQLCKKAAVTAQ